MFGEFSLEVSWELTVDCFSEVQQDSPLEVHTVEDETESPLLSSLKIDFHAKAGRVGARLSKTWIIYMLHRIHILYKV